MQKIDASVTPIQWPVSLGVAPKAEGPLTTKPGHSRALANLSRTYFRHVTDVGCPGR